MYPGIQAEICNLAEMCNQAEICNQAEGFDAYPGKGHSVQIGYIYMYMYIYIPGPAPGPGPGPGSGLPGSAWLLISARLQISAWMPGYTQIPRPSRQIYPGIQAEVCILAEGFGTYAGKGQSK